MPFCKPTGKRKRWFGQVRIPGASAVQFRTQDRRTAERMERRLRQDVQDALDDGVNPQEIRRRIQLEVQGDGGGAPTVADYANAWLERRELVATIRDERTRLERYVLPVIGDKPIDAVEPTDLLDLLESLRRTDLAQNTRRSVWGVVVTMFRDARIARLIPEDPTTAIPRDKRPKKAKRAQVQRGYLTAESASQLISDERVPEDRRVLWALMLFTGMRFGEAAGLRWQDYDEHTEGLGRLWLEEQWNDRARARTTLKGKPDEPGPPREIPVHPELAEMLERWRSEWPTWYGRHPKPGDPICPARSGGYRTSRNTNKRFQQDCATVGAVLRGRPGAAPTQHCLRNTFTTLAKAGGASEVWVSRITHNASGDVADGYTGADWPAMCGAVQALPIRRVQLADVVALTDTVSRSG